MDLEKLARLINNFEKKRLNLLRIPESQKNIIRPDYEKSKTELEDEINSIIDERITERLSEMAGIGIETDPDPAKIDEPVLDIDYSIPKGSDDKGSQDDTGMVDNDNAPATDDSAPELF